MLVTADYYGLALYRLLQYASIEIKILIEIDHKILLHRLWWRAIKLLSEISQRLETFTDRGLYVRHTAMSEVILYKSLMIFAMATLWIEN